MPLPVPIRKIIMFNRYEMLGWFQRTMQKSRWSGFYRRWKDHIDGSFLGLIKSFMFSVKVLVFVKVLDELFQYQPLPQTLNTPQILGFGFRHPLVPPFIPPYRDDLEGGEKYKELEKKIEDSIFFDSKKYEYLEVNHPMREESTTTNEYLFQTENQRLIEEMRHFAFMAMREKSIVEDNKVVLEKQKIERNRDIEALNARIKPKTIPTT